MKKLIAQSFKKPSDLLLEYTARVKDVELISNLQFVLPKLTFQQEVRLRTKINLSL